MCPACISSAALPAGGLAAFALRSVGAPWARSRKLVDRVRAGARKAASGLLCELGKFRDAILRALAWDSHEGRPFRREKSNFLKEREKWQKSLNPS
jgi:hypothetical protein